MTKCLRLHHDFDYFTTHDLTTFTNLRLVIDLETHFCTVNLVSRSITSRRKVVKVVRSYREVTEVVMWSQALCHKQTGSCPDTSKEMACFCRYHKKAGEISQNQPNYSLYFAETVKHKRYFPDTSKNQAIFCRYQQEASDIFPISAKTGRKNFLPPFPRKIGWTYEIGR